MILLRVPLEAECSVALVRPPDVLTVRSSVLGRDVKEQRGMIGHSLSQCEAARLADPGQLCSKLHRLRHRSRSRQDIVYVHVP